MVEAYVLHRRAWSESSLIIELFTEEHGRFGVLARGARRTTKRGRPPLQPLQPMWVEWRGRGELPTLQSWELAGAAPALTGDRLVSAMYLNELLYRLTERNDPHAELWDPYKMTLAALADRANLLDVLLRRFELKLLAAIGYAVSLDHEAGSDAEVDPQASYRFDPERGPSRSSGDGAYEGASLLALADGNLVTDRQRSDARRLMRQLIDYRLDGRPLKSRALFRRARPQGKQP